MELPKLRKNIPITANDRIKFAEKLAAIRKKEKADRGGFFFWIYIGKERFEVTKKEYERCKLNLNVTLHLLAQVGRAIWIEFHDSAD